VDRASAHPLTAAGVLLGAISLTALGFWLITNSLMLGSDFILDPGAWPDRFNARFAHEVLANSAEVVAAVLGIAITVVAIVVELAATRYSHLITRLFLREPVNAIVIGLLVITTIQCLLAAGAPTEEEAIASHAGFAVTVGLVTASLLVLLPYIYFVFAMLSPSSIIARICRDALRVITRLKTRHRAAQRNVLRSIEELGDIARGAIAQGDRDIALAAVQGLTSLIYRYAEIKADLPEEWFKLDGPVSRDPDFIALGAESLQAMEHRKTWLENKIFRQLVGLTGQSAGVSREVANVISINCQVVATELGMRDRELLGLCIRAFNSCLRATVNARDARTMYYVMNQYRVVGEALLSAGERDLAVEVAGYFREYGQIGHRVGISFLLEAAAYDVMLLIEHALEEDDAAVDPLLSVLLELDQEIKEESQEASLLGVRRTQIQVGALFLMKGYRERAMRVVDDLRDERIERLERVRAGLETDNRTDYWELVDRGASFSYLAPERRPYLDELFAALRS
jgi:hypothetical protein